MQLDGVAFRCSAADSDCVNWALGGNGQLGGVGDVQAASRGKQVDRVSDRLQDMDKDVLASVRRHVELGDDAYVHKQEVCSLANFILYVSILPAVAIATPFTV